VKFSKKKNKNSISSELPKIFMFLKNDVKGLSNFGADGEEYEMVGIFPMQAGR